MLTGCSRLSCLQAERCGLVGAILSILLTIPWLFYLDWLARCWKWCLAVGIILPSYPQAEICLLTVWWPPSLISHETMLRCYFIRKRSRRLGLSSFCASPFWFVVVLDCHRFGMSSFSLSEVVRKLLSPFWFVDVLPFRHFDCRRFSFSSWLYSERMTPLRQYWKTCVGCLYLSVFTTKLPF